jgi:phage terminase large subunit
MTATHNLTHNEIISKGFRSSTKKNTANLKSITGATHVVIEEADEIIEEDFNKLDESLRTVQGQLQIMLMLNTENPNHWIWSRWFRGTDEDGYPQPIKDANVLQIFSNYYQNRSYTSQSTRQIYEKYKLTNPKRYAVTVLGKLAKQAEGQIFTNVQPITELPDVPDGYGLDFRYTNDPTALTAIIIQNNRLYLDLLIYEPGLTNQQIASRCHDFGITRNVEIIADSAEPKSITELNNAGLWVTPAVKGADSILSGIQVIQEMEVFLTERSKAAWEEVNFYTWRTGADGKPINKPVDDANHFWDSVRYYVSKKKLGKKKVALF